MAVSSVIIVEQGVTTDQSNIAYSALGYRTVAPSSTATGTDEDPLYPFVNALDYRSNTKYSPLTAASTTTIVLTQTESTSIDYFAFAVHNAADAGMSGFFEVDDGTGYTLKGEFSTLPNNKPFMLTFDPVTSSRQRITFTHTSKLYIGSINVGKAIIFGGTPTLGFQPGVTAPLDTVEQSYTDTGEFLIGRRIDRGFETKASFNFVEFTQIDSFWEEYQNHVLNSKPIYFKWNSKKAETSYGLQPPKTLTKPTYVTSFHSNIAVEIRGYS